MYGIRATKISLQHSLRVLVLGVEGFSPVWFVPLLETMPEQVNLGHGGPGISSSGLSRALRYQE